MFNFQQIIVFLKKISTFSALAQIKLYIRENPFSTTQTPYYTSPSATWIVAEQENRKEFEFEEVCYWDNRFILVL